MDQFPNIHRRTSSATKRKSGQGLKNKAHQKQNHNEEWLENAFISDSAKQLLSTSKTGVKTRSSRCTKIPTCPCCISPTKQKKRKTFFNDSGIVENRNISNTCAAPQCVPFVGQNVKSEADVGKVDAILNHITSTPKRSKRSIEDCVPGTPELFLTEHASFNETDPLFAEISFEALVEGNTSDIPQSSLNEKKLLNKSNSTARKKSLNCEIFPSESSHYRNEHGVDDSREESKTTLKNKLRKTLKKNAHAVTPTLNRIANLRKKHVAEALQEAEVLQQAGDKVDIGPFYGLPSTVKNLLTKTRGISKLYAWQEECLSLPAVLQRKNLIYSLPTSGGKTLVAEILILRELLCRNHDALLILPFVAIVQEKVRGLSQFAVELDFHVEEYAASKGQYPPRHRREKHSLYIATIEKANSLVNSLVSAGRINEIGLTVVDELHMLGEGGSRGATLEMTLAKLLHVNTDTQIVGMSATLNNISDLCKFLNAELYTNDFRPVELTEHLKMDDTVFRIDHKQLNKDEQIVYDRVISTKNIGAQKQADPDQLVTLVTEVIPDHSCLVFCPSKKNCENVAQLLCKFLPSQLLEIKRKERDALLAALQTDGGGQLCPVLQAIVPFGLAYHHSGLTMDERRLIEEGYSEGTLCLLTCTSTLAAGVNLPAKRVILRSPHIGMSFLSRSQYKQMIGRAGRAGLDTSGESILIMQKKDKAKLKDLISGPCDYCGSSLLYEGNKGLCSLLLTIIGLKITLNSQSVMDFMENTLCYVQQLELKLDIKTLVETALQRLLELNLLCQKTASNSELPTLEVTRLGNAVFRGPIDYIRGQQLYKDLSNAQQSLVVRNYLHLLYLVTPYDLVQDVRPNWMTYLDELGYLDEGERKVAEIIGVTEGFIARKASGQRIRNPVDEFVVNRFYLTLVLYRLWRQNSIWQVAARFVMPRGYLQQLLNGAASFASCVMHFCMEIEEFWAYQDLMSNFVKRLSNCVTAELEPLMEIPCVQTGRARQLYCAGYKSVKAVAHANPETLVSGIEHMPRKTAKQIVASAKMLLQEKVDALREEVEDLIKMPESQDLEFNLKSYQSSKEKKTNSAQEAMFSENK